MLHAIVPLLISTYALLPPAIDLKAPSKDPLSTSNLKWDRLHLIADDIYGPDPRGKAPAADPKEGIRPPDEQHDPGLPANADRYRYNAPKDPYGGDVNNGPAPYPDSNAPY